MLKRSYLRNIFIIFFVVVFWSPYQFSYAEYDSYTVNIPNSQGGYIGINIKQSGNGYIGPKGEFYSKFPTVYQLQSIYATEDSVQREQMIERNADQEVRESRQRMIQQQQLIDQQIQQNLPKQQSQQFAQRQAQIEAQQQTQQELKQQVQQQAQLIEPLQLQQQSQPKQDYWGSGMSEVFLILLIIVIISLYFLPTIIAINRKHLNLAPIILVNFFLGWTFLGWVLALVWSFSHQEKK